MALTHDQVLNEMKEEDVVLLNILPAVEYRKLHIKGSFNVPLKDDPVAFINAVEEQHGQDKFFIPYGAGTDIPLSAEAAKILRRNGFEAEEFPGGLREWAGAGLPLDGTLSGKAKTAVFH